MRFIISGFYSSVNQHCRELVGVLDYKAVYRYYISYTVRMDINIMERSGPQNRQRILKNLVPSIVLT